jgi:hypothetical protein
MRFPAFKYMEWAKLVTPEANNLSRSGVGVPSWDELGVDMGRVALYGDHPYGYRPLLEAVAARAGADPGNVIIVAGASQAIFLTAAALSSPAITSSSSGRPMSPCGQCPRSWGPRSAGSSGASRTATRSISTAWRPP